MAYPKAAWGIEIGANSIKAIRLEREGDAVRVADFCVIAHKKVLTTPDLDEDEMIRLSLGQFISQKSLEGEHLVMSVPGHSAFARFAKLPPVEAKKIPDIVKFEAVQQIPFPIEEVEWDYQTFTTDDSAETEVGIFAITRDRIQQKLGIYSELGLAPESVTLSPVAVYNAMSYDLNLDELEGPVVFLDIGTRATDVIVAESGRCWIRTFPLGGTHFTEAIASTFKLSYAKAEKLKQDASTSKYAKQIMQAMRPVFSDLLQDLQRSIGYYQSLHRESELKMLVGLGSTFKIPGLRKFLGQQLQIDALRLDEYKKIGVKGREAADFAENTVNMATAYGLALQGVGLADISANLVPVKALREGMWHAKTKWFAAAAAIMVTGAAMTFYRPLNDNRRLDARVPDMVQNTLDRGTDFKKEYDSLTSSSRIGHSALNMKNLFDYRDVWPYLIHDAADSLASADPQPELLGDNAELILEMDPKIRRLIQLTKLEGQYVGPIEPTDARVIHMTMNIEFSNEGMEQFLNDTVAQWLHDNAERDSVPYKITNVSINSNDLKIVRVSEEGEEADAAAALPDRPDDPRRADPIPEQGPQASEGPRGMRGSSGSAPVSAPGSGTQGPQAFGEPEPAAGSSGPAGRPGRPPRGGSSNPDAGLAAGATDVLGGDIAVLAPIAEAPKIYPPGSTYYRATVTFTVELIDPNAPKQPAAEQASAAASTPGEEVSS